MKYKVGDKVRVVANITSNSRKDNYIGKTYTILNKYDNYSAGQAYGIGEDYVVYGEELELIPKHQSIHIYTDGITTTAILREGKKTIKRALAVCNPSDEFDFKIGASLAQDRLLDRRPHSEIVAENEKLKAEVERLQSELDKPTFDWEAFETQKIAVHCDTEEKVKAFLKECHDRGLTWCGGRDLLNHSNWIFHREKTCITSRVIYRAKSYYEKKGYTIVPCPVTAEPEPPKYYTGKVVCVDANGGVYHTVGKIYECKDGFLDSNTGKLRHNGIPYKSFENLQKRALSTFVELVED